MSSFLRKLFGIEAGAEGGRPITFGRPPSPLSGELPLRGPDWRQADPLWIRGALERALARPTGGWAVVASSRALGKEPERSELLGRRWVLFRGHEREPAMAPDACPHMGACLSEGRVDERGRIVCPWHGLALSARPSAARPSAARPSAARPSASPETGRRGWRDWQPLVTHDDGVLIWARHPALLAEGEAPAERPILPARPAAYLDAVVSMEARCEPQDVLANRLDPWHGNHFHPHSFADLRVIAIDEEEVTARVIYRVLGGLGVEVDARFHCPDARTIAMTIIDGEGKGSVVETHATPLGPGRTLITEATLASSERPEFRAAIALGGLLRPLVAARAERLWVEDAAYAERLHALRVEGERAESAADEEGRG